jgi:hypothetical protein
MLTKSDLAEPTVIEGWLRDLALTPTRRADQSNNWNLEFSIVGPNPLVLNVVNPKSLPRAIMFVCGMAPAPAQVAAFAALSPEARREFWLQLRATLNREAVEFQLDGTALTECPKALRVSAVRFDDGLTLDAFAGTLTSVCKACGDAISHFTERLGDVAPVRPS